MDRELYLRISKWRDETARREHVAPYRVISTQAVEGIAETQPKNEEELLAVKGIAEKKLATYGMELLALVTNSNLETGFPSEKDGAHNTAVEDRVFSVGNFLEMINIGLRSSHAKVRGEVSSLDIRDRYLFFGLKDAREGSLLPCMMWRNNYDLSGLVLEEGMEVAVTGYPEIYKPAGRFSFQAKTLELVGEGALKKAYDTLKKKLTVEGVFEEGKKKEIPEYPETIGIITSKTGAVIHDFLNNLGKYGYKIHFYDSRVEGQLAVRELIAGVQYFKAQKGIDVLVVMRGGGSLESLQAFNNEALVREIADCSFPVIAGIGHDKDVPLVSLASDCMVSTPTAATRVLNRSWEEAIALLKMSEERIWSIFKQAIAEKKHAVVNYSVLLAAGVNQVLEHVEKLTRLFERTIEKLTFTLKEIDRKITDREEKMLVRFSGALEAKRKKMDVLASALRVNSPKRQLELGYSIVFKAGRVVRSTKDVEKGEKLKTRVSDGTIFSTVESHDEKK